MNRHSPTTSRRLCTSSVDPRLWSSGTLDARLHSWQKGASLRLLRAPLFCEYPCSKNFCPGHPFPPTPCILGQDPFWVKAQVHVDLSKAAPSRGQHVPLHCLHSDVNSMYLSSTEPPAAAEWACLLRPLRGREPEGVWNLLSIVREMFKRRDSNAAPLLEILTDQCLTYEQVTLWSWLAPLRFIFSLPGPLFPLADRGAGEGCSIFLFVSR